MGDADESFDPRRVLVLDAHGRMLDTHCRVLEACAFRPVGVANVDAAANEIARRTPAVFVVDYAFPGTGELELAERLRGRYREHAPPMVLVSAHVARIESWQRLLFDEVLAVPYAVEDLGSIVRSLALRHQDSRIAPSATRLRPGIRLPRSREED